MSAGDRTMSDGCMQCQHSASGVSGVCIWGCVLIMLVITLIQLWQ